MSVAVLKELCERRNIKKIAMVDDVFDVPTPEGLDRNRYLEFRQRYNDDKNLKRSITWVSGTDPGILPSFDDLDDDQLAPLWKSVWKPQLGGRSLTKDHAQALRNLFSEHRDGLLGMLDTVVKLLSFFRNDLNLNAVTVHSTDYDTDEVAKAQIILIDYFLGKDLTASEAFETTLEVVKNVVDAARQAKRSVPSFLLVSARPNDVEVEKFRYGAQLMKSRFRFFDKEDFRSERIKNLVNLHDLIDASDRTETMERLIEDWQRGARKAIDTVREQMLALDVSDFVYLDCYRLKHEGRSIGNYLRWFLTASLNATVTGTLTKELWQDADDLKLFSVVDESGQLDEKTLIKTFDGPSDAIGRVYGDILFDESRGTGECAFPSRISPQDLVEGDIFVQSRGKGKRKYDDAKIRMVMTPNCDLISRMPSEAPYAQSVLLLPGILKRTEQEDTDGNFSRDYFIRVPQGNEMCLLRIVWDFRNPISKDWSTISHNGPGRGFKRLGRLRELYFHKIRDEFVSHLTRIATKVAPLFPHPRSGKVLIKVGSKSKCFKTVMCFSSEDRFIWEIGPVRLTRPNGRTENRHLYQASRQFVGKLTEALSSISEETPGLKESADRIAGHLKNMETYMDFFKPMIPGPRGEGNLIEFKKAANRSSINWDKIKSQSDLVVVPFFD